MSDTKTATYEGGPHLSPTDTVRVITDPGWGFHLLDHGASPEAVPEEEMTWAEAQERKLTGVMWCEAIEIDQVVLIDGVAVGVAGTPYGGDYFIVHWPHEPVSVWGSARTVQDAVDFYRAGPRKLGSPAPSKL